MSILSRRLGRIEEAVRPPRRPVRSTILAEPVGDESPTAWDTYRQRLAQAQAEYDWVVVLTPLTPPKPTKAWSSVMTSSEANSVDSTGA